jgi:hypothetical protein
MPSIHNNNENRLLTRNLSRTGSQTSRALKTIAYDDNTTSDTFELYDPREYTKEQVAHMIHHMILKEEPRIIRKSMPYSTTVDFPPTTINFEELDAELFGSEPDAQTPCDHQSEKIHGWVVDQGASRQELRQCDHEIRRAFERTAADFP